ncbi:hypothetical protein FACS1894105_09730 [Clostridia bacterium]|nr:hypothetical protein FACS1894105_09730 [Clostridia bacterium]
MNRLEIFVPDYNDSFSKVVVDGIEYQMRFTWKTAVLRWTFGLYTILKEPIIQGVKLVPNFPLDIWYVDDRLPHGTFVVCSKLTVIGRGDFKNGKAIFAYLSADL